MNLIEAHKAEYEKVIEKCNEDLSAMRAARANPSLVENITVEVYGSQTPIIQLASISIPDNRTILVQPWDKNTVKLVEQAIQQSDIGINPTNEGETIRLTLPQLTEETRLELTKTLNAKLEQFRVSMRKIRDTVKDEILSAEKDKEISEDEKFRLLEKLDTYTNDYVKKVNDLGSKKEKEIMTI